MCIILFVRFIWVNFWTTRNLFTHFAFRNNILFFISKMPVAVLVIFITFLVVNALPPDNVLRNVFWYLYQWNQMSAAKCLLPTTCLDQDSDYNSR